MTTTTKEDFSKFGKAFQESLCHLILEDRPFADQIFEVLDINFLELTYLKVFIKKIQEYKKQYGVHPSKKIMTSILRTNLNGEQESVQKLLRDYFARLLAKQNEIDGADYIKDTALDFCKKQKLKEAMIRSVDLIRKSSFDEIWLWLGGESHASPRASRCRPSRDARGQTSTAMRTPLCRRHSPPRTEAAPPTGS